ncbi:hypothetical protein LTR97_000070 [Elasticomyces elasticus]|uniref:Uncharacterized protein n=1 Tax=Elasticomyces elasticus TaxID=574655 RepID=A0AAN7WGW0_9PEZI|nr:hypothetical protein LTR97_000070 [Elasticomyces elasticus]
MASRYLKGFLWAFTEDLTTVSESMRMLDHAIQANTRFSKHGKHFAPFFQPLHTRTDAKDKTVFPLLVSVPFLDWTILGTTPPLRFQVDRREGFQSSKSSAHVLRSVLQYFYRLEDTADREHSQVFAKHKPWATNRELDLKVRQWYGHYPTGLNVDELWVLVIDAEHICTFSSNQTWKSRWPALQLSSRIEEVSFRGMRNSFFTSETQQEYAGHLSHLQYRLHRAPSTKLVMDLIACQEELNVVIQITQQQIDMLVGLQSVLEAKDGPQPTSQQASPVAQRPTSAGYRGYAEMDAWTGPRHRATYRQISASHLSDPMAQVLDNLQRELVDLHELRDNTDRLVTRTIQLVNIRLEDHGKAILVFTVVTIVFLPLNFVSSFFGMNFVDIRNMDRTQGLFWLVAVCVTFGVVAASLFLAFSGGDILEKLIMWRDARRERQLMQHSKKGNAPCEPKPIDPARTTTPNRFLPSTTSASQPRTLPPPFRLASLTKPSQDSAEIPDGHSAADASEYKDFTGCSMPLALAGSGLSVRQAIDQHFEHGEQDDYTGTLGFETDQTELAVHDQEAMYEYTVPQKRKADPESDEDSFPMQPELSRRRRKYSVDDEDSDEDEEMNTPTTHRGSLPPLARPLFDPSAKVPAQPQRYRIRFAVGWCCWGGWRR